MLVNAISGVPGLAAEFAPKAVIKGLNRASTKAPRAFDGKSGFRIVRTFEGDAHFVIRPDPTGAVLYSPADQSASGI